MRSALLMLFCAACGDEAMENPPPRPSRATTVESPASSDASATPVSEVKATAGVDDLFAMTVTDPLGAPTLTATQRHQSKGVNPANPTRQSCLGAQCHAGNATSFLVGLTVCADPACKTLASNVEVRIATGDGRVYQTFTGADGNAWVAGTGGLTSPTRVGIKSGSVIKVMKDPLVDATTAGSCNMQTCHGADPAGTKVPTNVVLTL